MNKGSKLKYGWLSILKHNKQLLVHSRTVNNNARIRAAHNNTAKLKIKNWKHTECRSKRMKDDVECFKNITECLAEYKAYPFDPDLPTLRTMQSGVPAPQELVNDFRSAGSDGEKTLETNLQERVYTCSKAKSVHARIKKRKRTTQSIQPVGGEKKVKFAEIEQAALKYVINLVDRSKAIKLDALLDSRVTEEILQKF